MGQREVSVSTYQASELLGVHESSVKRWCNADELDCWLTPGGHRRIPVVSLTAFADAQGISFPLIHFGEDAGRVWAGVEQVRRKDTYEALVDLTYAWIQDGCTQRAAQLIEYLKTRGLIPGRILDRIAGVIMHRIGHGYAQGTLTIGDEHQMTQGMRDLMVMLCIRAEAEMQSDLKPVAVVGCIRGEVHELGALMVRLVLLSAGWKVIYLGLNVPTEEFAAQQVKHGATLVCVSMVPPIGMAEAHTLIRLLNRMYDPANPYRLVLGGSALSATEQPDFADKSIPDIRFFNKMEPFNEWIHALVS